MIDEDGHEVLFSTESKPQIDFHLGETAAGARNIRRVLSYFRRSAELEPDSGDVWFPSGRLIGIEHLKSRD